MARARNIKPSFFKNEDLVMLPFEIRLLFIGLWTLADREGRLEDRPKRIKMEVFPADDVDIEGGLSRLADDKFIHRYQVNELQCIQIVNFAKHQNPHHKEAASTIPESEAYPSKAPDKPEVSRKSSGADPADSLIPDSLIPESLLVWSKEKGFDHPSLQAHWDYFTDYLRTNPDKRRQYRDLHAAFRNCVRSDWGNVRKTWKGGEVKAKAKPWFLDGWNSLVAKGKDFGLEEADYPTPPEFRSAVLVAAGVTPAMLKQAEADWK